MYMGSLEDNQNLAETIRTEFDAMLKSKDVTIQDLQEQLKKVKQTEKEATDEANSLYGINEELQRKIELLKKESDAKISDLNIMLSDKDKLNQALATSYDELKIKLESMMDEHKNFSILSGKYETLKKENEGLRKETDKAASIMHMSMQTESLGEAYQHKNTSYTVPPHYHQLPYDPTDSDSLQEGIPVL